MVRHGFKKNVSKDGGINSGRLRSLRHVNSFSPQRFRCYQCGIYAASNKGTTGVPSIPLSFTKCNWLCDKCYDGMVENIERRRLRLMKEEIDRRLAVNQAEEEELCVVFDSAEVLGAMKDLLDQIERLEKLEISRCCI